MSFQVYDTGLLEKFKEDVKSLRLRYPVAEIANMMGMDKGNISAYLSGKKRPGKKFLEKFYQTFFANNSVAKEDEAPYNASSGVYKMQEEIQQMKTTYSLLLQAMEEKLSRLLLAVDDMAARLRMMDTSSSPKQNKQPVSKRKAAHTKKNSPRKQR